VCLVDFHHGLPLAQAWGSGQLSSSDGQRFPTRSRAPGSTPLLRWFGYRRWGVQLLTWTSDQYSQYGTKVVPASVRDATHVLDEILNNETTLQIEEHTTDTHGYSELVFGLFDLLGLRFAPRLRGLHDRRLYRHGPPAPAGSPAAELLRHRLRPELIEPHWDELLRLAASLKHGWTSASLALTRLHANAGRAPLARALQEYGRLVKTNFALAWYEDQELRGRVGRQLNKGEALHALRRYVLFAREGRLRHRDPDDRAEQALCLNLVVDAIVAWNTVYAQDALDQLAREGHVITNVDMARLSPLQHAHINPRGRYDFTQAQPPSGRRPLHTPPGARRLTRSPTATYA
jgi:TnpA family transposase